MKITNRILQFAALTHLLGLASLHAQTTLTGDHIVTGTLSVEGDSIVLGQDTHITPDGEGAALQFVDAALSTDPTFTYFLGYRSLHEWVWQANADATAATVMKLVQDGALTLYDSGSSNTIVLDPSLATVTINSSEVVTESDLHPVALLSHTSTSLITENSSNNVTWGTNTTVGNSNATAWGYDAGAQGDTATAWGRGTKAEAFIGTALGRYNVGGYDSANSGATTWLELDPLFEIGNGIDNANRANAVTVLKNGETTLENKYWDSANPTTVPADPDGTIAGDQSSEGRALVVKGHTEFEGNVRMPRQGNISMGIYVSP